VFGREILDEWGYGTGERVSAVDDGPVRKRPGSNDQGSPAGPQEGGKDDQKLKISLPNSRMPLKPI
jgi:hypothetical protein